MKYSMDRIEELLYQLNQYPGIPLLQDAAEAIEQLKKENEILKKLHQTVGLPPKCGFCPQFINRINNMGQCKLLGGKIVKANQDCCCPDLRGKM